MATIETPPQIVPRDEPPTSPNGNQKDPRPLRLRKADMSDEEFHFLISELRDENSRSRMREAIWISIIIHMIILFVVKQAPRFWPASDVSVSSPREQINNQQLTYLDQKPDRQRVPKVESNKISDKDRRAMAKNPQLRKLLDDLRDNRRAGAPAQQAPQQQAEAAPPQPAPQQQASAQPQQQPRIQEQTPPQQQPNPFQNYHGASASSSIQNAARAAAAGRGTQGGEFGSGPADPNTDARGNLDILSDTEGVDFGPYLQRVLQSVKQNWYAIIPEEAKSPLYKQGVVAIEFAINPNGQVDGMTLRMPSGDVSLDRAAWGGISASNPFPPLPKEFHGPYLALRFRFYYNPKRGTQLR